MFVHHTNWNSFRYFIFIFRLVLTPSWSTTSSKVVVQIDMLIQKSVENEESKEKTMRKVFFSRIKLWLCWLDFFFHYFNTENWKHQISTPRWVSYFTIHQSSIHDAVLWKFEISSDWCRPLSLLVVDAIERREWVKEIGRKNIMLDSIPRPRER